MAQEQKESVVERVDVSSRLTAIQGVIVRVAALQMQRRPGTGDNDIINLE